MSPTEAGLHMNSPIRYIAEPQQVREVTLLGNGDLAWWKARLAEEGLTPLAHDGVARMQVVAATMRYKGVRFTEVSVSVEIASAPETGPAVFLACAFTTSRFFAWCERTLFSAPYVHANCRLVLEPGAALEVEVGGAPLFRAEMAAGSMAEAVRCGPESWTGHIHLPGRRFFHGRMAGAAEVRAFRPEEDRWVAGGEAPAVLRGGAFTPREWLVRHDGRHAKSKTHRW